MKLDLNSIERIMEKEGIKTQAGLAKMLGVNRSTMSRAMAGGRVGGRLLSAFKETFPEYSIDYLLKKEEGT